MKKLTAVNWIKNKIEEYGDPEYLIIDWKEFDDLINQAKKMEKEQIIDAWMDIDTEFERKCAEQYYNETFGKS